MRSAPYFVCAQQCCAFVLAVAVERRAQAQTVSWRSSNVGESTASAVSADGARLNAAVSATSSRQSLRIIHTTELQRPSGGASLDATSLAFMTSLPLGFGATVGATWQRPTVGSQMQHRVVVDGSLAFSLMSGLWLGARVRVASAVASPALINADGVSLDLAALYRPTPWLSLALTTDELLGPTAIRVGSIRTLTAGVAVRPTTTDVFTAFVDGSYTEAGPGSLRFGFSAGFPIGRARIESSIDATGAWRAAAGLELAWSQYTLGGGAIIGSTPTAFNAPLGFYVSAGWDSDRHRALPELGQVVVVRTEDDLGEEGLVRLLVRLERIKQDPSVRGVLFVPRGDLQGIAGGEELRLAFARLRDAGKRVRCHLDDAANAALLACSAAERTGIDPIATLRTAGLRSTRFFLGDALAEIGVRTQFVRIGPWKSAAEQFTRNGSSPEALAQEQSLLDSMLDHVLARLASARRWSVAHTREVLFSGPFSARESVERGLVDETATLDDFGRDFAQRAGGSLVRLQSFVQRQPRRWAGGPAIAVLHIHGDIVDGESQDIPLLGDTVGDRTIVQAIEAIAASSRIAAVVVRVDSGGGSASASERMWRALARLARTKPVVTSIGRSAASGGYYVAAPSREIFTLPTSITGSIGIFFGKADVAPLLSRLHVGIETTRRGDRADMDSIFRPFSQDEIDVVGRLIREHYNLFLDRVAEGRHRTRTQIHAIAEGRVFTGAQALNNGLADRSGGLLAALDRAAELGGLDGEYEIVTLPRADAGILGAIRSLVGVSDPRAPIAQMLARTELARAVRWLYAVSSAPSGQVMAMTEWPVLAP